MSVCLFIFLFVFRTGRYQVWKGRFQVFCITAPAQPSATVLPCIRLCCTFVLVIGIPQAPVLQTTNQQKALCRKLSVQRQHKSVLLFLCLFASNSFVSICLSLHLAVGDCLSICPSNFLISAPAKLSATVLQCIWPCCTLVLAIGIPQYPIL